MCFVLQILHADTSQVCGSNNTNFHCDGTRSTFKVLFKEPVEIQANTSYIASATLKVIYSLSVHCSSLMHSLTASFTNDGCSSHHNLGSRLANSAASVDKPVSLPVVGAMFSMDEPVGSSSPHSTAD